MAVGDGLNVLLVTPTGHDAELIADALDMSNVQSEILKDVASAADVFSAKDVGAMLIAEEALEAESTPCSPRHWRGNLRGLLSRSLF